MALLSSIRYIIATIIVIAVSVQCVGRGAKKEHSIDAVHTTDRSSHVVMFQPTLPSDIIPQEQMALYAQEHFWDEFRFEDSTYVASQDTVAMLQCFAFYVAQIMEPTDSQPLADLMRRAGERKQTLQYFIYLAEEVLHDPNSPLRNDELYIPVLESVVASPLLDKYEKMPYEYDLRMARKNRVGNIANDFTYTLVGGGEGRLHAVDADYVLILFSNPGCPMCGEVQQALESSQLIDRMVGEGRVVVLMLYPDEDVEAWREYFVKVPDEWIYARDKGQTIRQEELYDLKAIPSLYLIDREHRVMVKDASDVAIVESALSFDTVRGV